MTTQAKSFITLAILALFVGLIFSLFTLKQQSAITLSPKVATVFNTARIVDHFTLNDQKQQIFTEENLQKHWTFMFFGFTRCADICPTTMAVLKQVYERIPASRQNPAQVVFVTVDPENDTPEKLSQFVQSFHQDFIGVTGTPQELTQLQHNLGIMAMPANHPKVGKMIEHSGSIIVIDPQGEFYALFTAPHDVDDIVHDYKNMTQYYEQHA